MIRRGEVPGATDDILRTLDRFGFEWDGPIRYQSTRIDHYRERLAELNDLLYLCNCRRQDIRQAARDSGMPAGHYSGLCRDKEHSGVGAWRVCFDQPASFEDALQGTVTSDLATDDFIVWRRDGLPAYQWAVSVDDAEQGVTQIVRGHDLLGTTARQIFLMRAIGASVPNFMHLPVLTNATQQKLSKQTGATALLPGQEAIQLGAIFAQLGLPVCNAPKTRQLSELWLWAIQQWRSMSLKNIETIPFVNT